MTIDARHRNVSGSMPDSDCNCNRCHEEEQARRYRNVSNMLRVLVETDVDYLEPDRSEWGEQDHAEAWRDIEAKIVAAISSYGFGYGGKPKVTVIEWEGEKDD